MHSAGVNSFLKSAIRWPRKNREGRNIATSSYYESLVEIFESNDHFQINVKLWKMLLSATVNVAKFESFENWALVHRCFRAILDHEGMSTYKLDAPTVKVGLQVAELTNDTKLAADIICSVDVSEQESCSSNPFLSSEKASIKIPLSTYTNTITICINNGDMDAASTILRHLGSNNISKGNLGILYSLVLNGYAKQGNILQTQHILDEMEALALSKRYVDLFTTIVW